MPKSKLCTPLFIYVLSSPMGEIAIIGDNSMTGQNCHDDARGTMMWCLMESSLLCIDSAAVIEGRTLKSGRSQCSAPGGMLSRVKQLEA